MKNCTKCGKDKPPEEFWKGRSRCIECEMEYRRSPRGRALHAAASRRWNRTPKGKAYNNEQNRIYLRTERGKALCKRRRARNRVQHRAHVAVYNAIKAGKLTRVRDLLCVDCGETAEQYHHESYSPEERLDVVALCRQCHTDRHRESASKVA